MRYMLESKDDTKTSIKETFIFIHFNKNTRFT
jgi:hypothetical protein